MSLLLSKRILSTKTQRCPAVLQKILNVVGAANTTERSTSSISFHSSSTNRALPLLSLPFQHQAQQIRFKHAAKKGQHLQKLDEMAHTTSREEAGERRKKKKDKTAARKGKKGEQTAGSGSSSNANNDDGDEEPEEEEEEPEDDSVLPDPAAVKKRMLKQVDGFKEYLKGVRGAEPTPELFDDIVVTDAYGSGTGTTPLKSVAQVVIPSHTLAIATCFDPTTAKAVAAAIRDKLEMNPQIEEGVVKIPLPRVSMESRQQTATAVQKRAENYRQRIRKNRRTALDVVKQGVAGKLEGVSKDDAYRVQQEIEAITENVIVALDKEAKSKHDDIMAV